MELDQRDEDVPCRGQEPAIAMAEGLFEGGQGFPGPPQRLQRFRGVKAVHPAMVNRLKSELRPGFTGSLRLFIPAGVQENVTSLRGNASGHPSVMIEVAVRLLELIQASERLVELFIHLQLSDVEEALMERITRILLIEAGRANLFGVPCVRVLLRRWPLFAEAAKRRFIVGRLHHGPLLWKAQFFFGGGVSGPGHL